MGKQATTSMLKASTTDSDTTTISIVQESTQAPLSIALTTTSMLKASIQSTDATMTTTTIAQVVGELHEVKKGCSSPRWNSTRYGPPLNENSPNLRKATQKAGEVACCDYSGMSAFERIPRGSALVAMMM